MFNAGNLADYPGPTETTDPGGKPTTTTLVNQYNPELHSKHLSLSPQRSTALTPHQEKDSFQRPLQKLQLIKM